jgi:23S rRNA (uracil1939-C5)-methyltransferase
MQLKGVHEAVPIKLGQKIEIRVEGYGHEGEGVGRYRNFTVFIPEVLRGELVYIKITEVKKNFSRGMVLKILQPAPERVTPLCRIANDCGGCQLQHLNYADQLHLKQQRVTDAVERIGGLKGITIHPVLGMNDPWHYRNKVQYPFGIENVTVVMGFYRKGTHRIVPLKECLLQTELTNKIAGQVKILVEKYHVSVYDEQNDAGLLRHVLIKQGSRTGEVMVAFITRSEQFLAAEKIAHELVNLFPEIKSVVQNINSTPGNVILGPRTKVIFGLDTITEHIGRFKFKIAAESFFQVNPLQTEVLYRKAVEYAGLSGRETVLDAYCGVGSLTLFLAEQAKKAYGIEVVTEAVKNATENAALNEIKNVQFVVGATEKVLPQLVKGGITFQVGVVDPPRSGCEEAVLKSLTENKVGRIVYVSCNPSTLARDLKFMDNLGYKVAEIQPVDMFPHTHHVECVARVERR